MFPPFAPFFLLACSAGHWFLENEEKEKRKVKPMHYCRFLVVAKHDFLFLFTLSVCACECVCVIESMHTNVFVKKVCERLWGGAHVLLEVRGQLGNLVLSSRVRAGVELCSRAVHTQVLLPSALLCLSTAVIKY